MKRTCEAVVAGPVLVFVAAILLGAAHARGAGREIAITVDDLPGVALVSANPEGWESMTRKLIDALAAHGQPAIGFVNESKLYGSAGLDEARVKLLRMWLDAGLELGNHTYSHKDLHGVPVKEFEDDIVRGEAVTRQLMESLGKKLRYFRHPFLHTGRDLDTRKAIGDVLTVRGYTVAPVTIDNSEWIFAKAFVEASARGDREMQQRIASAYVPYMESKVDYYERQSVVLFGRQIRQILLVHANSLNADHFGEIAAMLEKRGYSFVTLSEALADKAYDSEDTYTGPAGITWLHRWALSRGVRGLILPDEPLTPEFVLKEAGVEGE